MSLSATSSTSTLKGRSSTLFSLGSQKACTYSDSAASTSRSRRATTSSYASAAATCTSRTSSSSTPTRRSRKFKGGIRWTGSIPSCLSRRLPLMRKTNMSRSLCSHRCAPPSLPEGPIHPNHATCHHPLRRVCSTIPWKPSATLLLAPSKEIKEGAPLPTASSPS